VSGQKHTSNRWCDPRSLSFGSPFALKIPNHRDNRESPTTETGYALNNLFSEALVRCVNGSETPIEMIDFEDPILAGCGKTGIHAGSPLQI
jgi:hypothetical protein